MIRWRYVAVALAAVLWAIGGTFARTLLDRGASALELTAARAWIAFVGVGLLLAVRRRPSERSTTNFALALPFGIALAAANYLYYSAIALLPVAVAIVVQYTAPGLVVLWKSIGESKKPSGRVLTALLLALGGVVLLSELTQIFSTGLTVSGTGLMAAFGSAIAFAAYMVIGERMGRHHSSEKAVFLGFSVASVFWILILTVSGNPNTLTNVSFLPGILFLGVFATIMPFLLFLWGLQRVKASAAGIISTLEPVAASVIAFFWLRQTLGGLQIVGAMLVVAGIAFVQTEKPETVDVLVERSVVE